MRRLHNCRVKRFPDGSADIVAASAPFGGGDILRGAERFDNLSPDAPSGFAGNDIFARNRRMMAQEAAYERQERAAIQDDGPDDLVASARHAASLERSKRRARVAVRDLGLCNDFRFFVTLTLDRTRINRYDPREILRHLNHWLDNNVRRRGLKYVLVPERHKDGAIHFHGFFNNALEAVDSGHKDKGGHTVYNLPGWGWGFSTAIELYGERAAAVAYTCKYISKAQEKIGGRWYYSGGDLKRPDVVWCDVDYHKMLRLADRDPFVIDGVRGVQFVQLRTDRTNVPCKTEAGGHREEMRELAARMGDRIPPSRPCVRPRAGGRPGAAPGSGRGLNSPPLVNRPLADSKILGEFDNFGTVNRAVDAPPGGAFRGVMEGNDPIKIRSERGAL